MDSFCFVLRFRGKTIIIKQQNREENTAADREKAFRCSSREVWTRQGRKQKTLAAGMIVLLVLLSGAVWLIQRQCKAASAVTTAEGIEIQTVKAENFEMDYFSFGTGDKTFVILPGASVRSVMLSANAIAASYACFAEEYTVYVLDTKKDSTESYTIGDMADDTVETMRRLGIEQADVFGCSLGGMIAQYIAVHQPERIHKMVLGSTLSRPNEVSTATCDGWQRLADSKDIRALNRDITQRVYSPAFYEQYKDIFAAMEGEGTAEEMERFSVLAQACGAFDIYGELDKISCPVLVMGSWDDHTLSGEACVEIAQKLRCPLYMYAGYGHAVYDEAPDYKARILDFLAD